MRDGDAVAVHEVGATVIGSDLVEVVTSGGGAVASSIVVLLWMWVLCGASKGERKQTVIKLNRLLTDIKLPVLCTT